MNNHKTNERTRIANNRGQENSICTICGKRGHYAMHAQQKRTNEKRTLCNAMHAQQKRTNEKRTLCNAMHAQQKRTNEKRTLCNACTTETDQ